jgi:GNAT superfamily N-acetyltransferase
MGMLDIVRSDPPPDDEILQPVRAAQVHVVVRGDSRGRGVGRELLQFAERWAAAHGIEQLVAGIQTDNVPGLAFYDDAGYRDTGCVKIHEVGGAAAE